MEEAWKDKNFEIITTEDGSPSLRPFDGQEMMHHSGGALAETQLIYGEVIREALDRGQRSFLSVGLGLGYVEFVIANEALLRGIDDVRIRSFEVSSVLRDELSAFILSPSVEKNPTQLVYADILQRLSADPEQVRAFLSRHLDTEAWIMDGALDENVRFTEPFQCVLFDAYSRKTSPDLWTEEFLYQFMERACTTDCVFSSYACNTFLKGALRRAGFEVTIREGFLGKRNSTLGRRISKS